VTTPAPRIDVRGCTEADWPAIQRIDETAFGYTGQAEEDGPELALLEFDRSLLAWWDGEPVGHTTAYTMDMSVPGGEVPVAGITWVSVLPTHRRRGVLTELMRHQTQDVHDRGEPVAALYASEPAIYPRFGFGLASQRLSVTIEHGYHQLHGPTDPALQVRFATPGQARTDIEQVYAAQRPVRAGMPGRPQPWWERIVNDPKGRRDGASELRAVVVRDLAGPRAYALFAAREDWVDGSARGEIRIREHGSLDAAAAHALWQLLLNVDLVGKVTHWNLAVDDVLLKLLDNPRRARPILHDSVYARLVDLPAALTARSYDVEYSGVIEVADELAPWNAGRWAVTLAPGGAQCRRTGAEPDLTMDVQSLGAAYLGSTSLAPMAAAGQIDERTAGSVAALSRALRHEPAAHCSFVF
jgi:predicted acetyltransferase